MRCIVDIGEVGISVGEREVLLRPSLYAMSQLGTPAEIVETFALMQQPFSKAVFYAAIPVLWACADEDISDLTGYQGRTLRSWVPGKMPAEDVVALARSLMKHGIVGALPATGEPKSGDYSAQFHARDYVAMAVAHLGASEDEAWNMTMTSLSGAMRSKYPPQSGANGGPPTIEEYDKTMDWFAEVQAKRELAKLAKAVKHG